MRAVALSIGAFFVVAAPAAASIADAQRIRASADRIAVAWPERQTRDGNFVDPVTRKAARGYGVAMLGHALLEAGSRRDDRELVRAGVRALNTELDKPPGERGVFDLLAVAAAYRFGTTRLALSPDVKRAKAGWANWLRTTGPPALDAGIAGCIESPGCFHNHEAVEADADLALLATRLTSGVPGTKLADAAGTRAAAAELVGTELPGALDTGGRSTGPGPRRGLGVIDDANTYPLAYDQLSTAMLGDTTLGLGRGAPAEALRSFRRALEAIAAFAGPDGDVAYVGRRQQQSWALAATVLAARAGALAFSEDASVAARFRALAARALERIRTVHGIGADGVNVVPRFKGSTSGGLRGLDFANTVVWNGLTAFLLDRAADIAQRDPGASASAPLTADADGSFRDDRGPLFAAVRRGDLWYAVNGRTLQPDLRYDAGLVALKRRGADGRWRDLVRPRPMTLGRPPDSAGPVLLTGGRTWTPSGQSVDVDGRGVVTLRARYVSGDADLGRAATLRYAPVRGGVRVSFGVRAGDVVRLRTFLPASQARRTKARAVTDDASIAALSPRPARVTLERGYASCCDASLVAATMVVTARRDGRMRYTVRDRRPDDTAAVAGVGALAVR